IEQGFHGSTKLDDLRFVTIFRWPGAVHEGKGEAAVIIDERATEAQRGVLLRIITGQDTEPGATVFNVFASTFEKLHDPIFAAILRRDRVIGAAALIVLTALAWAYVLWLVADMDMGGMDMSGFRMIPAGIGLMKPATTPWNAIEFSFVFAMWAVMMIGMMTP